MRMKQFVLFVLTIGAEVSYISSSCDPLDADIKIRHAASVYVLEADYSDHLVNLVSSNNTPSQKWRLVPSRNIGLFNIVNVGQNRTALDVGGVFDQSRRRFNVALNVFADAVTQQWYINADGSIVNGGLQHSQEYYVLQAKRENN